MAMENHPGPEIGTKMVKSSINYIYILATFQQTMKVSQRDPKGKSPLNPIQPNDKLGYIYIYTCVYMYMCIYIYTYQSLWKWRPIKSPIEIEIPFNPTTSPLNPGPASEFDVTLSLPPWQGEKELQISAPGNVGPWDAMRTTKNSGLKPLFHT